MHAETYSAGSAPRLVITGGQGALTIEAWDQRGFAVEPAGVAVSQEDAALVIGQARGDMRIRVPSASAIEIDDHQGDLHIAAAGGAVRLRDINGSVAVSGADTLLIAPDEKLRQLERRLLQPRRDVTVRAVGSAEIAQVHGSFTLDDAQQASVGDIGGSCDVRKVSGALTLGAIGGSCHAEAVAGELRIGSVGGSASLRAVGAVVSLGSVGGSLDLVNARLAESFSRERSGQVSVGGSARIELPEPANLTIQAVVGGRISGRGASGGPGMRTVVYGDGVARLSLVVGGSLTLA